MALSSSGGESVVVDLPTGCDAAAAGATAGAVVSVEFKRGLSLGFFTAADGCFSSVAFVVSSFFG